MRLYNSSRSISIVLKQKWCLQIWIVLLPGKKGWACTCVPGPREACLSQLSPAGSKAAVSSQAATYVYMLAGSRLASWLYSLSVVYTLDFRISAKGAAELHGGRTERQLLNSWWVFLRGRGDTRWPAYVRQCMRVCMFVCVCAYVRQCSVCAFVCAFVPVCLQTQNGALKP